MAASINDEKRTENRLHLTSSIFYSPAPDEYKDVHFWGLTADVSTSGLGIYANHQLEEGACIKVHSKDLWDDHKNASVIWCKEVGKDLYKAGLSFRKTAVNVIDISQNIRKNARCAEEELKESKQMLEDIAQSIPDSIILLSKDLKIRWANKAALQQAGLSMEELMGSHCYRATHHREQPCEPPSDPCPVSELSKTGEPQVEEHTHYDKNGNKIFVEVSAYPIKNKSGEIVSFVHISKDITERKKLEEDLRALSLTDELTGLYNRRGFFMLAEKLQKIATRQKKGLFMLYADLDGLKEINDAWGHQEGDLALMDIAHIFRAAYRESDVVARISGDEFVVFPVGTTDDDVRTIVARLKKNIDAHNANRAKGYKLSMSWGISYYDPENPCSIDELLSRADKLMYEQKKKTRKPSAEI